MATTLAQRRHYTLPRGPVQISFSGGRTSGFMLHQILEANGPLSDRVQVVFANTGRELPATLDFVQECADRWDVRITWVEWRPGEPRDRWTTVSHNSASRNGEPFDGLIELRGQLPNALARWCSRELKVDPAAKFLRSLGWQHWTAAVGIRADEAHRATQPTGMRWAKWYPLVSASVSRHDVVKFWSDQPFDLRLPVAGSRTVGGNCDGCHLKSEAALAALARDHPERHAWWESHEDPRVNRLWDRRRGSREQLRLAVQAQGDFLFAEDGRLCQARAGECSGD